jgi:hypothetical protein
MIVALQNIHYMCMMFYWKLITQARFTAADPLEVSSSVPDRDSENPD